MKAPTAISLFTGAGGLDLGFEAAGFKTRVAVEIDKEAVSTLRHNRTWPVVDRDIHEVKSEDLLKVAGLKKGEADILIGGPPCQPFSKSGYWVSGDTLRLGDPRAGTLTAYLRVLQDALPRTFLLENVPGLAFHQKSEGIEFIRKAIERIARESGVQYDVSVAKLNAADFGVPQMRERVFVIGNQCGRRFSFPKPTHGEPQDGLLLADLKPRSTTWDAIGDLEASTEPGLQIGGRWSDLLPSIPEGENYLWHTERGGGLHLFGWRRRYWSFLLKLAKRLPSWTIQAQPGPAIGPFHWKNRRLSARELCRLQTMPDSYSVLGNISTVQRQVGNAVPSALAEILAREIRSQLLGQTVSLAASLIPTPRLPLPGPEALRPVPDKYYDLVGEHEPHPGTGKGYAALRRAGSQVESLP